MNEARILALKVRLSRLVDAIHNCNALEMNGYVDIKLELWEAVERETQDSYDLLHSKSNSKELSI